MKIFTFILVFFLSFCVTFLPQKSEMLTVDGKIIESRVEKKWKYRSNYMGHDDFFPIVRYEYEVNGTKYESTRISFWKESYNSKKKAEKRIENYPLDKQVIVYYKKENPKESYLEVEDDTKEEVEE